MSGGDHWWAFSPLDQTVHVTVPGVPTARCGQVLPAGTRHHDQPPPGPPCEDCRVIFIADFAADPGRPLVELPPEITAPGGRSVPPAE